MSWNSKGVPIGQSKRAGRGRLIAKQTFQTRHRKLLQLAELFNCLDDALVWVKDCNGRYCWVNRAFLLSYSLETSSAPDSAQDVLGKTDYDLSPAFLADQFRLDDEQVLAGHRIVDRIEQVSQPDGTHGWNVTNKIPLYDGDGEILGTAGITRVLKTVGQEIMPGSEFGPVIAYMRDHYRTAITNRELAERAHMSVRAFERKFQNSFHLTPQKYLRKLQMRMASRALVYTRQSVAEVAASSGFADQSHFTREFRSHFGRTPREYRETYANGAAIQPVARSRR
jgi:AraC-like DNA-binding protein